MRHTGRGDRRGLNAWQPENLVAYASMARVLADEQLAGRLRIRRAPCGASEVLTDDTRTRVERAWGIVPFNVYAATETAGVGSECSRHRLHLFEDLVVTEVVDERDHPVPPGVAGARVLVTVPHPHAAAHSTRDERLPHAVLGAV